MRVLLETHPAFSDHDAGPGDPELTTVHEPGFVEALEVVEAARRLHGV